jgi:hypothetical protein
MFYSVLRDIESIFASSEWKSQNIAVYPDNYQGTISNEEEFCRFNVLPSTSKNLSHGNQKQLNGLLAVKIFVKAGEGQARLMSISNILNTFFENKKLTNRTELATSYLIVEGLDPSNKALYSASYFIPFTIYGE